MAQSSYTWTGGGGDNNWSTGGNWSGGVAPANPQAYLNFAGTTQVTSNNNLGNFGPGFQIYFNSGAGAFTLTGNAINFYNYGSNGPVIQNDSTSLQTVSIQQIDVENSMNLNANSGSLTFTSPFYLDNSVTLTANANTSNTITFSGSINNGGGSTGRVTIAGAGLTIFAAANSYTGETDINAGTLRVDVAPSNSTGAYYVGSGGAATTSASLYLGNGSTGGLTFNNAITENAGSGSNRVIGGSNTGGINTYSGAVTITDSNANFRAATGGTTAFNAVTASSAQTVAIGGSGYNGTVSLAGTSDNLNIGAAVNSGTLSLAKTSNSGVHAVGAGLTVNNGGTVLLGNGTGDQIFMNSFVTVNSGGIFRTQGNSEGLSTAGSTQGVGALTLATGSTLDFATGANGSTLSAASLTVTGSSGLISIQNWSGTAGTDNGTSTNDRLLFVANPGLSSAQLAEFQFYNDSGTAYATGATQISYNGFYEIVPVPEPSTWVAGILTLVVLGFSQRRRCVRFRREAGDF